MATPTAELFELARSLPIPVPWDRQAFIDSVAEMRGRPITLLPVDTAAQQLTNSPCGLWLMREDDDVIVHEMGTSQYHIDQICLHEVGHMLLGHRTPIADPACEPQSERIAALQEVFPLLDLESIQSILLRSHYDSEQERDAEMFASVLMIAAAAAADEQSMMRSVFFRRR